MGYCVTVGGNTCHRHQQRLRLLKDHGPRHGPRQQLKVDVIVSYLALHVTQIRMTPVAEYTLNISMFPGGKRA